MKNGNLKHRSVRRSWRDGLWIWCV